jgi:predicted lysophospholipase L1 biosynthesis ABC-type transport system permease subunit
MPDRLEVAIRITYVALYAGVCVAFLVMVFPGARTAVIRAARAQQYAWRLGVHRGKYARTEAVWSALSRADLPDEPAA